MRPCLRLLPLSLALGLLTIAHAKEQGPNGPHRDQTLKHPADEFELCRGDAIPAFPGLAPVGNTADRRMAPSNAWADLADFHNVGFSIYTGNVEMRHVDQWVFADKVTYNHDQDTWQADGSVKYQDNSVRLTADRANGDRANDVTTLTSLHKPVQYQLREARGNGKGDHGKIVGNQETFFDATYSTCDPNNRKWEIHGNKIDMDKTKDVGTAHQATIKIGNVPVLYLPWFTFSLDNDRKSGFLIPSFGSSSHSGFLFTQPYYFNLAPNYDATLTGRFYSERGLMLDGEFRFLTPGSHGEIDASFLPDDQETHTDRGSFDIKTVTLLSPHWAFVANIDRVSDPTFLQDFSEEPFANSIGLLPSTLGLYGHGRYWSASASVQDFQITDPTLTEADVPYRRVPDLEFRWNEPFGDHLELGLNSQAVRFSAPVLPGADRVDLYPYISLPIEEAAWYARPELGYRYTAYDLQQPVDPGGPTNPTRGLPIFDLDMGAYFDRDATLFGHDFVNTLEPRLFYLRVPYRNQDDIPIFDTQDFTFTYQDLFRTNSYAGVDRQANADQLTAAVTSRLLDAVDGREWLSASVGEIQYFEPNRVLLPGQTFVNPASSDLVFNTDLALDDRWTASTEYLYNPSNGATDLESVRGTYKFEDGATVAAMYRYRRDLLRETDVSFIYPLNENWRFLGRWDYSVLDRSTVEGLAGVEWQDCCMAVRGFLRDFTRDTTGQHSIELLFEIELKGLGSLGRDTGQVLDRDILGYSR